MDDPVQEQYEAYPYPARDPRDEAKRLITGSPSNLAELNHYLFAGRRDFAQPFRALVAGGGTGDATIMLAQQLADRGPGEVVYLDLSRAARAIAEARATARGLTNITFVSGSLLDLAALGLQDFDYIDCCGVLHHLEDPAAGLRTLAAAIKPSGGLGVMIYGAEGRSGLYPLQDSLARITGDLPLSDRVALTRRLLDGLPETNGFRRNPFLTDHRDSDAGLVDLLLHARDRAYTLPQFLDLIADADLKAVSMIEDLRYEPATYLRDPKLRQRVEVLPWAERAAIAETLAGNMKKHMAYLCRPEDGPVERRIARPDAPDMIPVLRNLDGPSLAEAMRRELILRVEIDNLKLRFPLSRQAPAILQLIDGKRTLAEVQDAIGTRDGAFDGARFEKAFREVYDVLNGLNLLHLLQGSES